MKYDLPPLNSLPAFEAAARNKSFTKAAEELCRTQAAISFQVRYLEKSLSVKLFLRQHRSLELTNEGKILYEAVRSAFNILASKKALIVGCNNPVTISLPISFCSKWFVPRLDRFRSFEPHVNLLVDANDNLIDLKNSQIQLTIRYCANLPEEFNAIPLIEDFVFPVCSPQLMVAKTDASKLKELSKMTFLEDQMTDYTWSKWLQDASVPTNNLSPEIKFSHTCNAIDAAIAGQGIALGRLPLVIADINTGRLVRPFPNVGRSTYKYYILRSSTSLDNSEVDAVIAWLIHEANETINFIAESHCQKNILQVAAAELGVRSK